MNFMKTYNLIPAEYVSSTNLAICTLDKKFITDANKLASVLRKEGLNVTVNLSSKKVGDQISSANKKKIPFILCIGEEEKSASKYRIKNLKSEEERLVGIEEIAEFIRKYNDNA